MAAATIQSFVDEIATKANIHPEAAETAVGTILFVTKGGQHHQGGSTFSTIARRNYAGLTVLLTSARGNRHFVIGRVMANILVRVLKIKNVMTYASSRGLALRARSAP